MFYLIYKVGCVSFKLVGIGGGIVMTTCLSGWPGTSMTQHTAVATSLVAMVPIGLAATAMNAMQGTVQYRAALVLALTSSFAMYSTARYVAPQVDEQMMRYIFASVLAVSAIRMLR